MPPDRPDCAGRLTSIAFCMQAFTLQEKEISVARIKKITELAISIIYRIKKIAFERNYDSKVSREFKDEYFTDASHFKRLKVIIKESTTKVLKIVYKDRKERETTAKDLKFFTELSETSVL
jgi:hypothetical protein